MRLRESFPSHEDLGPSPDDVGRLPLLVTPVASGEVPHPVPVLGQDTGREVPPETHLAENQDFLVPG